MSDADHDPFDAIERALEQIQIKHFEMAGMVDDYRTMVEELRDRPDAEKERLDKQTDDEYYFGGEEEDAGVDEDAGAGGDEGSGEGSGGGDELEGVQL